MNHEKQSILIMSIATIAVIILASLSQINTTLSLTRQAIASAIILILAVTTIKLLRKEGAIPSQLVPKYLPFPLILLKPYKYQINNFNNNLLKAIEEVLKLTEDENKAVAKDAIESISGFFEIELKINKEMKDTNKLAQKKEILEMYNKIENINTQKDLRYRLASLIIWIFRLRNLLSHPSPIQPDPLDALFAVRTALIYLKDRYQLPEANLYTKCPKCGKTNIIKIQANKAKWLKKFKITCRKCKEEYTVVLSPKIIKKHYELSKQLE